MVKKSLLRAESGQATLEYVLLLAVLVMVAGIVGKGLERAGLAKTLMKPITEEYAYTYKYGLAAARGFDEGTPNLHPRVTEPRGSNFRIFLNPRPK